ncbi:hypothetical protein SSBG_05340 [Streptomyces sp. SPB074]|nr:hypothetical protein SSBG_05340 [Streptomyces sp. SPB074]
MASVFARRSDAASESSEQPLSSVTPASAVPEASTARRERRERGSGPGNGSGGTAYFLDGFGAGVARASRRPPPRRDAASRRETTRVTRSGAVTCEGGDSGGRMTTDGATALRRSGGIKEQRNGDAVRMPSPLGGARRGARRDVRPARRHAARDVTRAAPATYVARLGPRTAPRPVCRVTPGTRRHAADGVPPASECGGTAVITVPASVPRTEARAALSMPSFHRKGARRGDVARTPRRAAKSGRRATSPRCRTGMHPFEWRHSPSRPDTL